MDKLKRSLIKSIYKKGVSATSKNYKMSYNSLIKIIYSCEDTKLKLIKNSKIFNKKRRGNNIYYISSKYVRVFAKNDYFIIDRLALNKVKKYSWSMKKDDYPRARINGKSVNLHVYLKGKKDGFVIDHINRDKTDNRFKNLRHVTVAQNTFNQIRKNGNKVPGVRYRKDRNKWVATISIKGNTKVIGHFDDYNIAVRARRINEFHLYGFSKI